MHSIPSKRGVGFVGLTTALSAAIWVGIELPFFDGDLSSAALQGVACGLAAGGVLAYSG
ncbi:hypothetical protein [Halobaculum rubrum]|uniref:hypothetical protein n=1 Tax=Halobaculum rubrum TaxID=2872158 RepID=UPI001CA410F7|nr:hypothetical protein [Halobaculum rubrum]QZY00648.1 hypothetical protein K6T25_06105 [Halobaculum rubrum]